MLISTRSLKRKLRVVFFRRRCGGSRQLCVHWLDRWTNRTCNRILHLIRMIYMYCIHYIYMFHCIFIILWVDRVFRSCCAYHVWICDP